MVEMVGGDAFYTASRHGHRRVSLETGHGRDIVFPVCSGPVERRLELPSSSVGLRVGQI